MSYFEVQELSKDFDGLRAVDGLSSGFEQGKVTSLIGPNGAGKTTVFNLMSGFLQATKGRVLYRGTDITGMAPFKIVELGVARTFQDLRLFYHMTVLENVLLGFQRQREEKLVEAIFARRRSRIERQELGGRAAEILGRLGLAAKSGELVRDLSYGEQKLLAIARAMATDADLLLLDEPAAGLGRQAVETILGVIRDLVKGGKTVLLIDHHMEAVMGVSDWVIVLDAGKKIAAGPPEEVQRNDEVIKVYLGL